MFICLKFHTASMRNRKKNGTERIMSISDWTAETLIMEVSKAEAQTLPCPNKRFFSAQVLVKFHAGTYSWTVRS